MRLKYLFITLLISIVAQAQTNEVIKKKLYVPKAGTLVELLTEKEANEITHLTLNGKLNAIDFRHLRDEFNNLQELDISGANITTYAGKSGTYFDHVFIYPSNNIPAYAFCRKDSTGNYHGKNSLRRIILSDKIKAIGDFAFKACNNLQALQINRRNVPNLMKEALNDSTTAIFVPYGSDNTYRSKEEWKGFAIINGEPTSLHLNISNQSSLNNELAIRGIQPKEINILTIEGKLDAADFLLIRDYMPNLTSVDISNSSATEIPEYTFTQKKFLLKITLPNQLKKIGQRAFSGCVRLSGTLLLPPSVMAIEFGAFMDCERLKQVIATGKKITALGDKIFGEEESKLTYQ